MPRICYTPCNFRPQTLHLIAAAVGIIEELVGQGYDLTVRQLYYQMVARDLFPDSWVDVEYNRRNGLDATTKNTMKNYKKFCGVISDARRAGLIDWDAIVDRGRNLQGWPSWSSPGHRMRSAAASYNTDKWATQPHRVEVWVEKDALLGVFGQACAQYQVPHTSCRGYTSDSEIWAAAQRLRKYDEDGQPPIVLQFSDHDPSGVDMERDITDRLYLFARREVEVRRIAFTWAQVQEMQPPPNPAKETDPRHKNYEERFGNESWELDAIAPPELSQIIVNAIEDVLDRDAWDAAIAEEETGREELELVARNFPAAVRYVQRREDLSKGE
jgi:hypothetical protein